MSKSVIRKGNLEYRECSNGVNASGTSYRVVLLRCPVCGYAFKSGCSRRSHFLNEHSPEEFGL